jgi:prepilin-type N-terminal cleavage/methylation domain-containing protein/prepilin-type processing-associated H-X9-DG protein
MFGNKNAVEMNLHYVFVGENIMERRKAFTLVELLVVISIIALLLSILMPTLNKAREQARNVVCASNVKQVVTALVVYAAGNDDYVIPANTKGKLQPWDSKVAPYFGTKSNDSLKAYLKCPQDKKPRLRDNTGKFDEWQGSKAMARSYAPNIGLGGYNPHFGTGKIGEPVRMCSIKKPHSILMIVEQQIGCDDENYGRTANTFTGNVQGTDHFSWSFAPPCVKGFWNYRQKISTKGDQHKNGGNWGYVDGHVAWYGYDYTAIEKYGKEYQTHLVSASVALGHAFKNGPVWPESWWGGPLQ